MKNLLLLTIFVFILYSCDKIDEPEILGTFLFIPEGCVPENDPMLNCSSFVTLSEGGTADILLGGDIVYRTSYQLRGQKIKIAKSDQFDKKMTFELQDDGNLKNIEDNSVWVKED